MFDDGEVIILGIIFITLFTVGLCLGITMAEPTELPNGCILYEDAIYCEVAE